MEINGQQTDPNASIFDDMKKVKDGEQPESAEPEVVAQSDSITNDSNISDVIDEPKDEPKHKYRIGGKEFDSQEEAFAWAEEMDRQAAIREAEANAYRQAYSNMPQYQQPQQNVTPEEDDFDQKFYENPKEYLKQMADQVRAQTRQEIMGTLQEEREEEQIWRDFTQQNPDLTAHRDLVELTANKYAQDIKAINQTRGQKAAYDYVAQKVRARFQEWADSQKPRRELPNTRTTASGGSHQNVTPKQSAEKPSNFFEEMRKMRGV